MVLRTNANPPLDSLCNDVNAEIRFVPLETKPVLVKRANVLTSGSLQVRRYFANLILRELQMHQGRLGAAMKRIQMHIARAGSELSSTVPYHGKAL